jgi:hypothetical protein
VLKKNFILSDSLFRLKCNVLAFHEELSEIGARFYLGILYPFGSLKPIWFHAGCADIKLAVEIFYQAFHKFGNR